MWAHQRYRNGRYTLNPTKGWRGGPAGQKQRRAKGPKLPRRQPYQARIDTAQPDTRPDRYLHSSQRGMRALARAMKGGGE